MIVVYIAGPYTGSNAWDIEQNIRVAEAAGLEVAKLGAMPLIPHSMTRFYFGALPEQFFYGGTLELLRRCDVVLFVGDWEGSKGAMCELEEACREGILRFFSLADLEIWLKGVGR